MSGQGLSTEFPVVEKGYDPTHVDQYLAGQMLQLREQTDAATARIAQLEADLQVAREREEAIQLTLMAATQARDQLLGKARANAEEIVGAARREALTLMQEARRDADRTIAEAKAMLNEARTEALSVVNDAETETNRLLAERQSALTKLHADYETQSNILMDRINTLRSIAEDLSNKKGQEPPTSPGPSSPHEGRTATAPPAKNVPDRESDGEAPIADRIRGSFSGRRSAKLPRIGDEAGRSALAAATAMRAHLSHEQDDSNSKEGLAVRTA